MKIIIYYIFFFCLLPVFTAGAQTNNIQLLTPQILKGTVVNDSYYYGGIAIGTAYAGDAPFTGWERGVFYSLDGGDTWEAAVREELPYTDQLDFAANSFPGNGFEADAIQMYRVAPEMVEAQNRGTVITVGIYVKSDYNAIETAALDDGNFVVTWRKKTAQSYDNIYCQVFGSQGNKLGDVYLVSSQQGQSVYFPRSKITALENGSFIITWENHLTPTSPSSGVQAKILRYKNGVISERNAFTLNAVSGKNNLAPAVVQVPGGFVAFTRQWWWESNRYFHSGFYGRQYDVNGSPVGDFFNIASTNSSDTEISNSSPVVLSLDDGSRAFVWEERPAQLFVQKLNSGFSQTGSRFKVTDIKAYDWTAAANTGNGFLVSWVESSGGSITGQFFAADGSQNGSSFPVNDKPDTEAYRPYSCSYADGGCALSWLQYNHSETTYQFTIRKYQPDKPFQEVVYYPQQGAWNYSFAGLQGTNCIASYLNNTDNRDFFLFTGLKSIHSHVLSPAKDIDIQCRVFDPATGKEWLSPVRSYLYANPDDGLGSTIIYEDGYTNNSQARVVINLTAGRYKSLNFYLQKATLENGQGGTFGEWEAYDPVSTLTREVDVSLADGFCYRFKYIITNMADKSYEITGNHVLCCDTTPPVLDILNGQLEQSVLRLTIDFGDGGSGMDRIVRKVNKEEKVAVTDKELLLELIKGPNHIMLEAADKAGNMTVKHLFKTVELVNPEIYLTGIKEQGEYGDDLVFGFQTTVPLTDTGVFVDEIPVQSASPGTVSLDLRSYPEGSHQIAVKGRDLQGNPVEKAVNIIVKHGTFNLVLLSPGEREYGSSTLPVDYWASTPVTDVWYQLDSGEKQTELLLTDLSDGSHELTLYAVNTQGYQGSCSVVFTVKEVFPVLEVMNPVSGGVYPSRTIDLVFNTNANVEYMLGDENGAALPGNTLTVPEDGAYELILTATHSVSGNLIRKSIPFIVDSVTPVLKLHSPESKLYTYNEINIDYSTNKAFYEVKRYLDGEEVDVLRNLKPGAHAFEIRLKDNAGRTAEKRVTFQVAKLEIASPAEGERIISAAYPCIVPFVYEQEGWFGTLTEALDNQQGRLITEPPGTVIPLETDPGNHELHLRGYMNEFNVARKTSFQIGRKNLVSGPGSIGYSYRSLGMNDDYEVSVSLNIKNSGDLDIEEPVVIRFDAISPEGAVVSYWKEINALPAGENRLIQLENLTARLGDLFTVIIDPERELMGEDPTDNSHRIEFLVGQITGVTDSLSDSNAYLSGVSVWNEIQVYTAGPVAYVEIHAGDKIFVDNTPEDGFRTIVDMGLLSADRNYLQILAYGSNDVVLDSRKQYYDITRLPEEMGGYAFPWNLVASEDYNDFDHIIISELDRKTLLSFRNDMMLAALSHPPCIIPRMDDNEKVIYKVLLVVSEPESRAAGSQNNIDVDVPPGDYAKIGGGKKLPTGRGFISEFSYDPAARDCIFEGIGPFYVNENQEQYFDLLQNTWGLVAQNIDEALLKGLHLENYVYERTLDTFLEYNSGTKKYTAVGNITNFTWNTKLQFDDCFICSLLDVKEDSFKCSGGYSATGTGVYNFTLGKSASGSDKSDFIIPYLLSSSYSYNRFAQNIPLNVKIDVNALIEERADGRMILNPILSRFRQSNDYRDRPLFDSSSGYTVFFGLFSGNTSYHSRFSLSTRVYADLASVIQSEYYNNQLFSYSTGTLDYRVTKEWERCFLWWCWGGTRTVVNIHQEGKAGSDASLYDGSSGYTIDDAIKDFIDRNR